MKTYLVTSGANDRWRKEEYSAESYSVDEDRQLHLWIGGSHVASFAQGCWTGVEEAKSECGNCAAKNR